MTVLNGFRVVQIGPGLAAAVCGRLLADAGAMVMRIDPDRSTALAEYLNGEDHDQGPARADVDPALAGADLIVCEGSPATLRRTGRDAEALRRMNGHAALVLISPFGQTGPRADEPATDLTLFFASGIARMLTGQADDLDEPPMCPVGQQSAFIGGLAAACAGMHAALLGHGAVVDVSIHEALATMAITELTRAGRTGKSWSRERVGDGNGATVCILPACDGYVAISPREDRQWASWLSVMGAPDWGTDARFKAKQDRVANWDALHALMSQWSREKTRQWIAEAAQAAHVPSFPLRQPLEHLGPAQLHHRNFFRAAQVCGQTVQVPGSPFGLRVTGEISQSGWRVPTGPPGSPLSEPSPQGGNERTQPTGAKRLPLSGIRVLDFSWVIAGPTATRYLAAMGAEVIKIEAPGRGDPGRATELHTVLGQAKQSIVLDLKNPAAIEVVKALAVRADVLVENFATGVMDRLGLGTDTLCSVNPRLIYVSASGLGRTGPEAHAVAYGTLLQCYAGFAGLNRHPGVAPRVGMAWLDPMCGLLLAFVTAAALWQRRAGPVVRVDFSMLEAMLWTMAGPLLSEQLGSSGPQHQGGVFRCAGADDWLSIEPAPDSMPDAGDAGVGERRYIRAGIAAAALARSADLVTSEHLAARGFWDSDGLPSLPWIASFGRATGPAPGLGGDTDAVLCEVLGMKSDEIQRLRENGVLG